MDRGEPRLGGRQEQEAREGTDCPARPRPVGAKPALATEGPLPSSEPLGWLKVFADPIESAQIQMLRWSLPSRGLWRLVQRYVQWKRNSPNFGFLDAAGAVASWRRPNPRRRSRPPGKRPPAPFVPSGPNGGAGVATPRVGLAVRVPAAGCRPAFPCRFSRYLPTAGPVGVPGYFMYDLRVRSGSRPAAAARYA